MTVRMTSRFLALALVLAATLGGCSVSHRSDAYACTKPADCNNGRQCVDGFCVLATTVDAAPVHSDAATSNCPAACSTCNVGQKTCTIDCLTKDCTQQVTCPSGYHCNILCDVDNSCSSGVNCQTAASCTLTCSGRSTCQDVQCGLGACNVNCSGQRSCRAVSCGNSCACDVLCTGSLSCAFGIQCSSQSCTNGLGCTSLPPACHTTCP